VSDHGKIFISRQKSGRIEVHGHERLHETVAGKREKVPEARPNRQREEAVEKDKEIENEVRENPYKRYDSSSRDGGH